MLFCPTPDVNAVWSVIARATAQNDLGIAAKVAPYDGDPRKDRLICVYTKDFTNRDDVTRVLKKLKALGLFEMKGRPLYYKCGKSLLFPPPSHPVLSRGRLMYVEQMHTHT